MPWRSLLAYTFENHAALDETGHGFHGRVELPAANRWEDTPARGIATAILYDHPESKIVCPTRPAFSGWRGVRVRVYFKPDAAPGRLNLVEGDGSFALFVEPGGILRGTINDGSLTWWGVSSEPNKVRPGRWYFAELLYDAGQLLALSLNGELLGVRTTAGLPIQPVGAGGIRVGYWPGGDARYTFRGLMGPVWIDTLDEREPIVGVINKLLCTGSNGTSRLETWTAILDKELTDAEKAAMKRFGATVVASVKRLIAVVVGQASDPARTVDEITALADDLGRLAGAHELAGTDLLLDPAFPALLQKIYSAACRENPAAPSLFAVEALQFLAAMPVSPARWKEIFARHPGMCRTGMPPIHLDGTGAPCGEDGGWIGDVIGKLCEQHHGGGAAPGGSTQDGGRPPCDVGGWIMGLLERLYGMRGHGSGAPSGGAPSSGAQGEPCGGPGSTQGTGVHVHAHAGSQKGGAR